jgi:GNAT superfamily N-acetyltransferase
VDPLQPLDSRHVSGLLALWSRRWGDEFPLDLALWRQNTEADSRHFRGDRCWIIEDGDTLIGSLALKTPGDPPAWPGQDPRHAWISFLLVEPGREPDAAPPLVDQALKSLRRLRFGSVSYGGDPSHFFPGAPEADRALGRILETAGFRPGEIVHDLVGDLQHYRLPTGVAQALHKADVTVSACDHNDTQALLLFIENSFPGRWAYETRQRLAVEPSPGDILVIKRGAEVIGFCHTYHRGSRRIGPSISWRRAIGDHYGGLGPMGVAPAFRRQGLGFALLARAVDHLRRRGVTRVVIDWTTLVDFYGRLGFQVWRTYRSWRRVL